jgi:hypothetical protein
LASFFEGVSEPLKSVHKKMILQKNQVLWLGELKWVVAIAMIEKYADSVAMACVN